MTLEKTKRRRDTHSELSSDLMARRNRYLGGLGAAFNLVTDFASNAAKGNPLRRDLLSEAKGRRFASVLQESVQASVMCAANRGTFTDPILTGNRSVALAVRKIGGDNLP
jgi:hypothetical protein